MTLLRHVEACNRFDADAYLRFAISGEPIGWIGHEAAAHLVALGLATKGNGCAGIPGGGYLAVSAHLARIAAALAGASLIAPLRNEMTPVLRKWGAGPCAEIDRAGLPALGLPAFGIHVNGYVRTDTGLHLWVGHRARDRQVAPGKLDHLVAGGITSGYSAGETVIKEAEEEAGLTADIARLARPVGQVTYRMSLPEGLRNDTLFIYDLELPQGVVPVGNDGEVERFELMPIAKVMEIVRETDEFKFNVNLVLIDFMARHGLIDPDREPDYVAVVKGLRR
jgi:8-oxo-dGTP pyrophosphatase MutT (NUDIX family)